VKRIIVILGSVMTLIALSVTVGGAAWSATTSNAPSSTASIIFDDVGQQAKLVIPTPACPETQPDCQWKFVLQIPKGDITVGVLFGTSGTLTIAYPRGFCGVIQADAYQGPPFVPKRGFQHTIPTQNCEPPVPTVTTTTTSTTTTEPPPPTTGPPTPPTAPPPASHVVPPVVPVPTATPVAVAAPKAVPTQLPFTGVDTKPLLAIGLLLVMLGMVLLNSTESWRRMARRLLATVHSR